MVSKDLFLRVHHITSYWRVLVLDWIRQLLRAYAPFDVRRRLHYEFDVFPDHTSRWRWTLAPGSQYGYWRIITGGKSGRERRGREFYAFLAVRAGYGVASVRGGRGCVTVVARPSRGPLEVNWRAGR